MRIKVSKTLSVILFPALLFVGLVLALWLNYSMSTRRETERADQILMDSAHEQVGTFTTRINAQFDVLQALSRNLGAQTEALVSSDSNIWQFVLEAGGFTHLGLADRSGKQLLSNTDALLSQDVSDQAFFQDTLAGKRSLRFVRSGTSIKQTVFVYAVPVFRADQVAFVLYGRDFVNKLVPLLSAEAYDGTSYSFVCDADGHLIVEPEISEDGTSFLWQPFFDEDPSASLLSMLQTASFTGGTTLDGMADDLKSGRSGIFSFTYNGASRCGVYEPLGVNDWFLFNVVDRSQIHENANLLAESGKITAWVVLLFAILSWLFYAHRERQNMRLLAAEQEKVQRAEREEQRSILESNERLRLALQSVTATIWDYDLTTHEITQNENSIAKHGFQTVVPNVPEGLIESGYVHPESAEAFRALYDALFAGETRAEGVFRLQTADRQGWWYEHIQYVNLFDASGKPYHAIGMGQDVTDKQTLLEEVQLDSLTGLFNHSATIAHIRSLLARDDTRNETALFMVDIDHFKSVNDTLGHHVGDDVLVQVAGILRACFRTEDILGRVGGDEYLILLRNAPNLHVIEAKAIQLVERTQMRCGTDQQPLLLSVSIGVALHQRGESFDSLYVRADKALYQAKSRGRNQYCLDAEDAATGANPDDPEGVCACTMRDAIPLQALLENLDGGVLLIEVDDGLTLRYVSPSFFRFTGITPSDLWRSENALLDMLQPEYREKLCQHLREGVSSSKPVDFSYPATEVHGRIVWRHIRAVRIPEMETRKPLLIAMVTDITEIKKSTALLDAIVDNTPFGIGVFDVADGLKPVYVNRRLQDLVGFEEAVLNETSGADPLSLVDEQGQSLLQSLIQRVEMSGEPQESVFRTIAQPNQTQRYLHAHGVKIRGEGGEHRILVLFNDITRQKALDQMLTDDSANMAQAYERMRAHFLFEQCATEAFEVNIAEHTLLCSQLTQLKYHLPSTRFEHMPDSLLSLNMVHPDSVETYRCFYADIFSGVPEGRCVLRLRMGDNAYALLQLTYQTIFDSAGLPLRAIGYSEEVTHTNALKFSFDQEEKLQSLMDGTYLAAFRVNLTRDRIEHTAHMSASIDCREGCAYGELLAQVVSERLEPDKQALMLRQYAAKALAARFTQGQRELDEALRVRREGQFYWVAFSGKLQVSPYNGDLYLTAYLRDITELKKAELALPKKPERDPLTGLYKQQTFQALVDQALVKRQEPGACCGMMVLQVQNYADLQAQTDSDSFARLRMAISRKLLLFLGLAGIAGELSDDRICVFCPHSADDKSFAEYAQKLFLIMNSPSFLTLPEEQHFQYVMGAVSCTGRTPSCDELIASAMQSKGRSTGLEPVQCDRLDNPAEGARCLLVEPTASESQIRAEDTPIFRKCSALLALSSMPCSQIETILAQLTAHFSAERACVLDLSESNCLHTAYSWPPRKDPVGQSWPDATPLLALSAFRRASDTLAIQFVDQPPQETDCGAEARIWSERGIRSLFVCPLLRDRKAFAFVALVNPSNGGDRQILSAIARMIGDELIKTSLIYQERQMRQIDTVSGAKSRVWLTETLTQLNLETLESTGVFIANILGLAALNTRFGTETGDQILHIVADHLKRAYDPSCVYRYGDSLFLVLVQDASRETFYQKATDVLSVLDRSDHFSVACGYTWSQTATDIRSLIANANTIMLAAREEKERQKDVQYSRQKTVVETKLLAAIEHGKALVYLQPKLDLKTDCLCGAEALVRMRDDDGVIVPPNRFIPLLEEMRLVHYIDHTVLRQVVSCLAKWRQTGQALLPISLNYSRSTLLEPDAVGYIQSVCREYDVDPRWIEIEITESLGDIDTESLALVAKRFADAGIQLSLDDFGAKYSNLAIFGSVPFNTVKLDKAMIDLLPHNDRMLGIARSVIGFCHQLNISVIAEGVEQVDQAQALRLIGCDCVQGYWINKPMPIQDFEALYKLSSVPPRA